MDLLEIRKKAKEKEGKDTGQPSPEAPVAAPAENQPEVQSEVPVKMEKKEKRKRQTGKKAAGADAKPEELPAGLPVEPAEEAEAVMEEATDGLPEDVFVPPAGNAGNKNTVEASAAADAAAPAPDSSDEIIEYLAFMLANEEYAVRVEDVKEIIRGQSITTVPRTPGFVIGIISLRGVILPVFDIKKRLGLDGGVASRKTSRIIVVADKYGLQGIMVDKVTGVVKLKGSAIEPPPAIIGGVEAEYLQGLGRIGDRLLILFNTDKVLTVG